jgi:hypothetical protein
MDFDLIGGLLLGRAAVDGSGAPPDIVRCASHVTQPLGFWRFRPLELRHLGAPDSPVRLLALLWLCASCSLFRRLLRLGAVAPLAHRTVWWIIEEWLFQKPEGGKFELIAPGAPDTIRWHIGQSVRQTRILFGFFCSFLLNPNFNLFIGLCWTFDTCRTYNLEQTS